MNFAESQRNPGKHPTGLIIVIVMHVLLAYALVSGLARKVVDVVKGENTTTIEDQKPPPPPPPPEKLPPPPPTLPPPPVFTPPPEVNIQQPPTPDAPRATNTQPAPTPERPVQPVPVEAPKPRGPSRAHGATYNFNDPSCRPEYPARAAQANAQGVTRLQVTINSQGKPTDVKVLQSSGSTREHRLLDRAAQEAFSGCPFKPGEDENGNPTPTIVVIEYAWTLNGQ